MNLLPKTRLTVEEIEQMISEDRKDLRKTMPNRPDSYINSRVISRMWGRYSEYLLQGLSRNAGAVAEAIGKFAAEMEIDKFEYIPAPRNKYFVRDNPGLILILKEKPGDRYLDASTPTVLAQNIIIVARERWNEGWFKSEEDYKPADPQPDLFNAPEKTQHQIIGENLELIKNSTDYDIFAARNIMEIMMARSEYEYEGMEFIYLERPK